MKIIRNIKGKRFGNLLVVRSVGTDYQSVLWECRCDCGLTIVKPSRSILNGIHPSCGCWQKERKSEICKQRATHGMAKTKIYGIWRAMRSRCENPKDQAYHNYGGRGIKVCERWKTFWNFFVDMGERPKSLTLERKNNHLGYSKENCIWADRKTQSRNSRNVRVISAFGFSEPLSAMAERFGIKEGTLRGRLDKLGWSIEKALTTSKYEHR